MPRAWDFPDLDRVKRGGTEGTALLPLSACALPAATKVPTRFKTFRALLSEFLLSLPLLQFYLRRLRPCLALLFICDIDQSLPGPAPPSNSIALAKTLPSPHQPTTAFLHSLETLLVEGKVKVNKSYLGSPVRPSEPMSVPNVTLPAFNGLNDDCETFVSSIQQLALSKEKHTDDKWIAGLVAGCLCGDALVWFAALDPTTQESWHSLRRRLLERYGIKAFPRTSKNASPLKRHSRASSITSISSDGSAYSTSSTSVCSSPAIPAPKHYSPKNISSGARAGRIAVTCGDKSSCGFISRSPDRDGVYYVTQNASEALHVQVEPAKDNQLMEIRLMNSSVTQEHLGVTWYNSGNPDMRYGSSSISGLSATRITPLVVESSASELYRGPESSTIWSLGEGDALEAKWPTGSGHAHKLVMAIGPGNLVYFVPDQCSWIEGSWFGRYVEARLTFEPFIRPLAHSRNSSTLSLPSPARLTAPKLNDGLNPKVRFLAASQESAEWSSNRSSAPKPARFGRVRVISNHPSGNGYIGTTLSNSGALLVSHVDEDIPLEVRCPEGRGILHNLELMNARTDHTWLGMTWLESKAPSLCPGSSSIAALSHVSDSRWGYSVTSTSNKYAGEKGHAVWNVHDDGTVRATWSDGIVSKSLSFVTDPASRELFVVPDKTSSWLGEFWGYVRVELMFESE